MYEFRLPDIGEGISEAELLQWSVRVGQRVEEGDEIATISTDKVNVELPAPRAGVIGELCATPGTVIKVGTVLVRIDDGASAGQPAAASRVAAHLPPSQRKYAHAGCAPAAGSAPGIVASPSTRRLAARHGVDLARVPASGPGGRILRADVERMCTAPQPERAHRPASTHATSQHDEAATHAPAPREPLDAVRREPLQGVRAVAAAHLANSVRTLAHSTMSFEARGDALLELRDALRPRAQSLGIRLTPLALFACCIGAALREHPRLNAIIDDDARALLLHRQVNLSVAVATDAGLQVPVLHALERMSLYRIAESLAALSQRARDARLTPADTRGGTFTLSSTGALEQAAILSARPIVNAPQTATLWLSRIAPRPRVSGDRLEAGPMLYGSLSFDHRFIDGADAVRFINDAVKLLECPQDALARVPHEP